MNEYGTVILMTQGEKIVGSFIFVGKDNQSRAHDYLYRRMWDELGLCLSEDMCVDELDKKLVRTLEDVGYLSEESTDNVYFKYRNRLEFDFSTDNFALVVK